MELHLWISKNQTYLFEKLNSNVSRNVQKSWHDHESRSKYASYRANIKKETDDTCHLNSQFIHNMLFCGG